MPLGHILLFLARGITTAYRYRQYIIRIFQQLASELAIALFISVYHRNLRYRFWLIGWLEKLVDAYIYFIGIPCLIGSYGREICNTTFLHSYFWKFSTYQQFVEWTNRRGWEYTIDKVTISIINTIIAGGPFHYLREKIGEYMENPMKLINDIGYQLGLKTEDKPDDPFYAIDFINQNFKAVKINPESWYAPKTVYLFIHPTLDLDWAVIKSFIALLDTYKKLHLAEELQVTIPPFIRTQRVRIYENEKLISLARLDEMGRIKHKTSTPAPATVKTVTFDTYGLRKDVVLTTLERIVVMGGHNGEPLDVVEIYIPDQDKWYKAKSLPTTRCYLTARTVGGKVYAIGGNPPYDRNTTEYDPMTDTWTEKSLMPEGRSELGAAVVNKKIYVSPGWMVLTRFDRYDTETDTWERLADFPKKRRGFAAESHKGKVYLFGGYGPVDVSNETWEYDPETNTWEQKANMPYAVCNPASAKVKGKAYIIGGEDGWGYAYNQEYDFETDSWKVKKPMEIPKARCTAKSIGNKIYVIGGYSPGIGYLTRCDEYDPETNTWKRKADMTTPRWGLASAILI